MLKNFVTKYEILFWKDGLKRTKKRALNFPLPERSGSVDDVISRPCDLGGLNKTLALSAIEYIFEEIVMGHLKQRI